MSTDFVDLPVRRDALLLDLADLLLERQDAVLVAEVELVALPGNGVSSRAGMMLCGSTWRGSGRERTRRC